MIKIKGFLIEIIEEEDILHLNNLTDKI